MSIVRQLVQTPSVGDYCGYYANLDPKWQSAVNPYLFITSYFLVHKHGLKGKKKLDECELESF